MSKVRMFPLLWPGLKERAQLDELGCPRRVPWSFVKKAEARIMSNHDQSLETLARRGGLDPVELMFAFDGRDITDLMRGNYDLSDVVKRLRKALELHETEVKMEKQRHPSITNLLRFFKYDHLPPKLQAVSKPFCDLAYDVGSKYEGPEAAACLRKLLEAKDCAVRAAL